MSKSTVCARAQTVFFSRLHLVGSVWFCEADNIRHLESKDSPTSDACWDAGQAAVVPMASHWRSHRCMFAVFLLILGLTSSVELLMGRSPLGPDGKLGLWEGNVWSSECSQRLADPYSFSHVGHGILFFGLLRLVAGKVAVRYRFLAAAFLEAGWELLENSPLIINRYRETTIALGYVGDSVINSMSDIVMMSLGFLLAFRLRTWMVIAILLLMEIGCLLWIRDNLTLNIIMLLHPIPAIKAWQMAGQPGL